MLKSFLAVCAVLATGSAAVAGPYVNVENNAGYDGWDDYVGSTTDLHVGYEGGSGAYGYYIQAGPSLVAPEAVDAEFELSGKVGGSLQAAENLSVYVEASFLTTDDDPSFGTKLGAKYNF